MMIDRDYQIESLKNRYKDTIGNGPLAAIIAGIVGLVVFHGVIGFIGLIAVFIGIVTFFTRLNTRMNIDGEIRKDTTITEAQAAYIKT